MKHGLSSVFSVHPFTTFSMKNKRAVQSHEVDVFQCLMNIITDHINSDSVVWLGTKLDVMDRVFRLEPHSVLELCAKQNDKLVFQSFVEAHLKLFNFNDIAHIMETAINHGFGEIEKVLVEKLLAVNVSNKDDGVPICELKYLAEFSIMNNRLDILESTLTVLSNVPNDKSMGPLTRSNQSRMRRKLDDRIYICDELFDTSCCLHRRECTSLIKSYCSQNVSTSTDKEAVWKLLLLLLRYPNSKDRIKLALNQIPNIENLINSVYYHDATYNSLYDVGEVDGEVFTPLELYTLVGFRVHGKMVDTIPRVLFHTLFECGASVDAETLKGRTILANLLNDKVETGIDSYTLFRNVLEEILYANPRNDDKSYVDLALIIDTDVESDTVERIIYNVPTKTDLNEGDYRPDCIEHPLFGCVEPNVGPLALSFTAPLLLECGFSYSRDLLEQQIGLNDLHPDETSYLTKFLEINEMPRRLDLQCRDKLRKYFKGRYIHDLVAVSNIPKQIKDFILLHDVLNTLKH